MKKCLYAGILPSAERVEKRFREHGIELVKVIGLIASTDHLSSLIRDVDGILAGGEPYPADVIRSAERLRIIARAGVGFDKVDIETAAKLGVYVTITPIPELSYAIAEQALALILALMKKVPQMNEEVRQGIWRSSYWWDSVGDLYNSTIGLFGVGRIGSEVARRAKSFGMKVIYYDLVRRTDLEKTIGLEFVTFDELLAESDILSIHIPLTKETRQIINEEVLFKMKKNAILVNTARGAIIDESALLKALTEGRIAGAGIDVFSEEPLTTHHPFYKLQDSLPNLIVTEHSISLHTVNSMINEAAEEIIRVLSGQQPKFPVNFPSLE